MRKAKILATLGPASNTPEKIEMMIESGISAVRINMSHGTHEEHTAAIANARAAAMKLKRALSVLVDLSGPKIRTRTLKDKMPVELKVGELFTITTREIEGNQFEVATNFGHLPEVVEPG
ncbi:MAG: pyruvate kinase, partial [Acidobacteriota bacterium]